MSKRDVKVVAVALWNLERRDLQKGGFGPSMYSYADGAQEPMPFHLQDVELQKYYRDRARRVLRALRRKPS